MSDPSISIDELMDKLSEYDGGETATLDKCGLTITNEDGNELGFILFTDGRMQ